MNKIVLTLALDLAFSTSVQAAQTFDALSADFYQETAISPYFKGDVKLPPGFSPNDFTLLDKAIANSQRYAGYTFNHLDYIKDYQGQGSDLVALYGDEIVLIKKSGDNFEIKSASKGSDKINNSSKFYKINDHYFILQGLSDETNISEYRLLKLDGYQVSQVGSNIATKGTDLPPASEVSLSLNTDNYKPRIVFLEPQVWLELPGKSGNYKQNSHGRVTLELQNGQWNLVSGEKG